MSDIKLYAERDGHRLTLAPVDDLAFAAAIGESPEWPEGYDLVAVMPDGRVLVYEDDWVEM